MSKAWPAIVLLLGGCGYTCPSPNDPVVIDNIIRDVSFAPEHDVHHAKTGWRTVPDKWFINICEKNGRCDIWMIPHAPWDWETQGSTVLATWRCNSWDGWIVTHIESKP